jgi:hypothetical protein
VQSEERRGGLIDIAGGVLGKKKESEEGGGQNEN